MAGEDLDTCVACWNKDFTDPFQWILS